MQKIANQSSGEHDYFLWSLISWEKVQKILNPKKRVVMADGHADCPMAHMVDVDKIREVRNEYPDVSVVCYVNSTAEIKAESDVCVTSSNALKIVKNLPNKDIFFIPDENLGRFVASQLPEKHFIFNDGFCHVHTSIHKEELQKAKEAAPGSTRTDTSGRYRRYSGII